MIFYLTYNEQPSGIYSSQVIDAVRFMNSELQADIKLISFISMRNFFRNRKIIKKQWPKAVIIPMIPGIKRWRANSILLKIAISIMSPTSIIARSVLATNLALNTSVKKVIYDGRGAIAAEWEEYNVINDKQLMTEIKKLEQNAVINANFRIAVSEQLVKYWQKNYGYNKNEHVIIPCTIDTIYQSIDLNNAKIETIRKEFGFDDQDMVFVYAGSLAGWQSFDLLNQFALSILGISRSNKILFLSDKDERIEKLKNEYPNQVRSKKLDQHQVPNYLMACNYGLLIREQSVTNEVASPVKFAEYLACGLKVIISEHIGDYSDLVKQQDLGYLYTPSFNSNVLKTDQNSSNRNKEMALKLFTKRSHTSSYKKLLEFN